MIAACESCLRRTWLLGALGGRIEAVHPDADRLDALLALEDDALIAALGAQSQGALTAAHAAFDARAARAACARARLDAVCRHDPGYPEPLDDLRAPPAVVHIAGRGEHLPDRKGLAVAIVGARRASAYGLDVARALGRGLGAAGLTVVSGMAFGVDAAAHAGAVEGDGLTVAVLAGGADIPYPASSRRLYRSIIDGGCAISELPPGFRAFRWCFPARNRLIAALSVATIVVEAAERSGSLITAKQARELGRDVAAVPGAVTSALAAGTNALLKDGAHVIRGPQDALDLAAGVGAFRHAPHAPVEPHLAALYDAVATGADTVDALAEAGIPPGEAAAALAELELAGALRRTAAGRYVPVI